MDDDSSAIFSDGTSSGSESPHGRSSTIQVLRREKLNQFLHICCKEECGSGQPQKSWENMDVQRKNMYVPRAATAIAAALEVITPGDAGHLWEAVQLALETPNVIRTMIPQRIIEQYTQFCKENNMRPFGPSTISRILCVCSATVQKSLQGLDYMADGTKAFDDLAAVVVDLGNHGRDRKWVDHCERALQAGKQYIKTDYKVNGFNIRLVCSNALSCSRKQTSSVQGTSIIPIPNIYGW